ncbi:hypothetical protein AAFM71_00420 [Chromobacterium violaceum]|uniref:hypothetical protein n=1 Tax=Chromobacterium violaceum TaxID=536 RepID=UPI00385D982A
MKRATVLIAAAAGTAAVAAWLWLPTHFAVAGGASGQAQPVAAKGGGSETEAVGKAARPAADGFSFAVGGDPSAQPQAAALPPETPAERARKQELRKLGYMIDARYYQMSLADLRMAASRGDPQALTHLAERYLFQLDGKPREPDYQPDFRYREEAREALQQAYARGNLHAAAIISESYLLDKQPEEAAAWNLVARRSGDALSADWLLKTKDYQALTAQQKANAARRADQLWQSLQRRKAAAG